MLIGTYCAGVRMGCGRWMGMLLTYHPSLHINGCKITLFVFSGHLKEWPASGLIHRKFIPEKTQEGHVRKENPGCGFSSLGSQRSHHIFIKR